MENKYISIYSDESHHLKNQSGKMVIGAVWCSSASHSTIKDRLKLLKQTHNISPHREIKWTKISPAKLDYYKSIIELFFEQEAVNFRAVVVPKSRLRHGDFDQTEDEFYYKMQYIMLSNIVKKNSGNLKIYLDYKDTWSNFRTKKLVDYLDNTASYDHHQFQAQPIRSTESVLMQLTDLLIGAVAYANNSGGDSGAKAEIVKLIEEKSGQKLTQQTPFGIDKVNIFNWEPYS